MDYLELKSILSEVKNSLDDYTEILVYLLYNVQQKKSDNISSYQYRYGYFFILVLPFCFINFEILLLDVWLWRLIFYQLVWTLGCTDIWSNVALSVFLWGYFWMIYWVYKKYKKINNQKFPSVKRRRRRKQICNKSAKQWKKI